MNCTNKFQKQKKVIPMAMTFRCLMLLIIFPTVFYGQTDQSLIHATYLGGSDEELGGPALDTRPGAWLFGSRTLSADMPITDGAFQQTKNSDIDGYFGIFDRDTR